MLPLHIRRRSHAIVTTMVVIVEIVITIEKATTAEVVGDEVVSTLRIGAKVRLVEPISSLTCHAIAGGGSLISTVPTANAWYLCPLLPHTSLL